MKCFFYSANSLRATLKLLANIEGPKCDAFTKIMQCLAENMRNSCGEHAYTELETMLKVMIYLQTFNKRNF
jgi:hypothetical protein